MSDESLEPPSRSALDEASFDPSPIEQFRAWYQEVAADPIERDAMALATATSTGAPSLRIVLLRGFDTRGFVFFTSYASRKGRELDSNPNAALSFHWPASGRQVRIEGNVVKLTGQESDAYFDTRPVGSRLSAIASPQSEVIASREHLESRVRELSELYPDGGRIPRPASWGGYRVVPHAIEFWQIGEHRLHDRLRYARRASRWVLERLAP